VYARRADLYVDPDGCFAIESGARRVELWAIEAIRLERVKLCRSCFGVVTRVQWAPHGASLRF
jgi:hypothetical protein